MLVIKDTPKNVVCPQPEALHIMLDHLIESTHKDHPEMLIQSQAWKDLYSFLWHLNTEDSRTWLQRLYLYDDYLECNEYNDDNRQQLKNAMSELSPYILKNLKLN